MMQVIVRAFEDELFKLASQLDTTPHTERGGSSSPIINFRRLEEHANEHRLMELLGLGSRGRPLFSQNARS